MNSMLKIATMFAFMGGVAGGTGNSIRDLSPTTWEQREMFREKIKLSKKQKAKKKKRCLNNS